MAFTQLFDGIIPSPLKFTICKIENVISHQSAKLSTILASVPATVSNLPFRFEMCNELLSNKVHQCENASNLINMYVEINKSFSNKPTFS